jgi:flagellar hook-associated protein 2
VWATVTASPQSGPATVVLSDRATGAPATAGSFIAVSDTAGSLTEETQYAQAGVDAEYTINGGAPQYSSTNTISGAAVTGTPNSTTNSGATQTIPGVSLSLNGTTGSTPVSVTVGTPAPSAQNIQTAVQQFITDYNSAISTIQTQLAQPPSNSDPTQGTLFGDQDLQQLLSNMREQMDATVGGLTGSITSMLDVGVSTGAASGSSAPSQSAISGNLTLDVNALTQALTSNGSAVKSMLQSWSINFSFLVNNEASPGGTISTRIQGDSTQINYLGTQIANLQAANTAKQQELVNEFAQMEAMLSSNQSTSSWLTSQIAALPTP